MIVLGFVAIAAIAAITMLLWNALIPELFGGPVLSYWQTAGLLILSHILLRGWGPWRHRGHWRHDHWGRRMALKMEGMTPEEREKFRAEWRNRCGWDPDEASGSSEPQTQH